MTRPLRAALLAFSTALLAACGGDAEVAEQAAPADTTPAAAEAPPGPPVTLADFVGRWDVRSVSDTGDSLPSFILDAAPDSTEWTLTFPGRPPLPVRVISVAGDSIITFVGPYESVIREGVQVTLRSVSRLREGRIEGRGLARYITSASDSLLTLQSVGTRIP